MIEVKERVISRKWGWISVYDIYSDGVLVAIKDGGHYDCTARKPISSLYFSQDGNQVIRDYCDHKDFTLPFTMTEEILELCRAKVPAKTWYVSSMGKPKSDNRYSTYQDAANSEEFKTSCRWDTICQELYTIP